MEARDLRPYGLNLGELIGARKGDLVTDQSDGHRTKPSHILVAPQLSFSLLPSLLFILSSPILLETAVSNPFIRIQYSRPV